MIIRTCFLKVATSLVVFAALLVLPSCFESHCHVKVKKDGSGTIETKTIMGAQMVGMMQASAAQNGGEAQMNPLLDEKSLKAQAAKMGEGVELVSAKDLKFEDGRKGALVTYKFADISKLALDSGDIANPSDDGEEKVVNKDKQIQFAFTKGDQPVLTVKMPKKDESKVGGETASADAGEKPEDAQDLGGNMNPMFQGMKIGMTIEVDGSISETTATYWKGSTITLTEIDFSKVMAHPDFGKKVKSADQMQEFSKFADVGNQLGAQIESKPEIKVVFHAEPTLPHARMIKDVNGRVIDSTVLSANGTSIHIRRNSDGKEFDIPLVRLSPVDKSWLGSLRSQPANPVSSDVSGEKNP